MLTHIFWLSAGCFSATSVAIYMFNEGHLLISLLALELLGLSLYLVLCMLFSDHMSGESFFSLFYLVVVVSEGMLGLSILIGTCWSFGGDQMKSMSIVMC